jgi:hypothetical protein
MLVPIDQNTIKTQNPKCRFYWCLIKFIDWRGDTVSHVGIFDPSCKLVPLYLLSGSPPPLSVLISTGLNILYRTVPYSV